MIDEQADVMVDSSTTEQTDVTPESSQAAPVETTTQKVEQATPEVPFNEHPRWQEIMEERKFLREQLAIANSRQVAQQPAQAIEADPYAGMDAETKTFYQNLDKRNEAIIKKAVAEKEVEFKRELSETKQILATVAYERFQSKHPDVSPNSPEEAAIAKLYSRGYALDDAYKVAMFDKMQNQKVQQAQVKKTQTIQNKVAANVETSTIPANSGLPQGKKQSIREYVEEQIRKGSI